MIGLDRFWMRVGGSRQRNHALRGRHIGMLRAKEADTGGVTGRASGRHQGGAGKVQIAPTSNPNTDVCRGELAQDHHKVTAHGDDGAEQVHTGDAANRPANGREEGSEITRDRGTKLGGLTPAHTPVLSNMSGQTRNGNRIALREH